jgi:diguanylate cyclase (GGDEF)-like protein
LKTPDIPDDEQARLETLRLLSVLDTPAEERFDRLTRIAKRLFAVPIALVSLVDENRQWFKSCIGLTATETPRDVSFCGHAILDDGIFVVPDASQDERFADNPLVVGEPHIRFYAGCPLHAPNGLRLGTLCIIDYVPRHFSPEDYESLTDLALMVERELAAIELATQDELTKISNRRGFMMLAQQSLNICARQKLPLSLVFIDLDKFKLINDTFGHAQGDKVLSIFAHQLKKVCRDMDVCGRLGGDEFVLLLAGATKQGAEAVITRLNQSLAAINLERTRDSEISYSHGILEIQPDRLEAIEALLAGGDTMMYQHKKANRS